MPFWVLESTNEAFSMLVVFGCVFHGSPVSAKSLMSFAWVGDLESRQYF